MVGAAEHLHSPAQGALLTVPPRKVIARDSLRSGCPEADAELGIGVGWAFRKWDRAGKKADPQGLWAGDWPHAGLTGPLDHELPPRAVTPGQAATQCGWPAPCRGVTSLVRSLLLGRAQCSKEGGRYELLAANTRVMSTWWTWPMSVG